MNPEQINKYSEQLLLDVKMKKDTSLLQSKIGQIDLTILETSLVDDDRKKAFWINIYNAYYQILRIDKKIPKSDIYKKKLFLIAGNLFSLDDVEHGILRKYKYKYSLGYLSNIMTSKVIKKNTVNILDYRIHFALNCGAKSCPPIAFYDTKNINQQLNLATQSFLESETDFNEQEKIVSTTTLFKWFYADFGGNKGIKKIFFNQLGKDISDYKIKYKEYSWEEDLSNFIS